jgi:hypothetical protein
VRLSVAHASFPFPQLAHQRLAQLSGHPHVWKNQRPTSSVFGKDKPNAEKRTITASGQIGWFGVVGGNVQFKIPGGPLASSEGTNSWFMAFEIGEDSITQLGPTTLTPLP